MSLRWLAGCLCVVITAMAAWLSGRDGGAQGPMWQAVHPGVFRSAGEPAGFAVVDGDAALLIDAPHGVDQARPPGVKKIEMVLLTHHHRDTCAAAAKFLAAGVKVRAPKASAEWLTPDNVKKYWQESIPLRGSRTAYLVVPVGFEGIDCSLADGETIKWRDWTLTVLATPGHSRDQVAYVARKGSGPPLVFCGDAVTGTGKMWSPYTTDWDHWTDVGLKPAAESLRKLAGLKPAVLFRAHGDVVAKDVVALLNRAADLVEETGFLKSFERFTKQRLGNAPEYKFLAKEQAESNGSKPWSRVSDHLWLTGNTYVLVSKDNACLILDPWDKRSADQVAKLRAEQKLGPVEVVMFSHAHYDHYDGVYHLPERDKFEVWTLDVVSGPISKPLDKRLPFLDARPVKFDRTPKDGDTLRWREYAFRFHFFPGQSYYTMGVETVLDGKKCFLTADNFFHQDMFSGSGGWMGLNEGLPANYGKSAKKVLDAAPDWVLAEHGGPFEFSAEDFKRRIQWAEAAGKAADAISPSGHHWHDWSPVRVSLGPWVHKAKAGATLQANLIVHNRQPAAKIWTITLEGRGLVKDQTWEQAFKGIGTVEKIVTLQLSPNIPLGRQVFTLRVVEGDRVDPCDAVLVVDVEK